MPNDVLDGFVDLTLQVVTVADNVNVAAKYLKMLRQGKSGDRYLLIEEAGVLIPFGDAEAVECLENEINGWLLPGLRGVAYSSKDVLKKLKRLGFREKSTEGSHVQLENEERKTKVTVPVHGGTVKKGTLKSILRQAGIDLETLAYA